jgi:hypothetical protein
MSKFVFRGDVTANGFILLLIMKKTMRADECENILEDKDYAVECSAKESCR